MTFVNFDPCGRMLYFLLSQYLNVFYAVISEVPTVLTLSNDRAEDFTRVSNLFIDEYMSDANDAQLKIYLYLQRMMNAGLTTTVLSLAEKFNFTEKEVLRSLRYWEKRGLLALHFDSEKNLTGIHFCDLPAAPAKAAEPTVVTITGAVLPAAAPRKSTARASASANMEALRAFQADEKRKELLFIIERYIGKPLSPAEIKTIYYIAEVLKFNDELIDFLVQYCVDHGKKDFRYIEKVALNWAENGITTSEEAAKQQYPGRGRRSRSTAAVTAFNKFEQNQYNFAELEQTILEN